MLEEQRREQGRRLRAFAHDHRVGQLDAEQQAAHAGVGGNGAYDVGHARAGLLVRRCRGDCGLRGGGDVGDHGVEDRCDEVVLVGEALVEVPNAQARLAADGAHRQFGGVLVAGAEQLQTGVQQAATTPGEALGRVDAAVGPDLCHKAILTPVSRAGQDQETHVLTFADRGGQ